MVPKGSAEGIRIPGRTVWKGGKGQELRQMVVAVLSQEVHTFSEGEKGTHAERVEICTEPLPTGCGEP